MIRVGLIQILVKSETIVSLMWLKSISTDTHPEEDETTAEAEAVAP